MNIENLKAVAERIANGTVRERDAKFLDSIIAELEPTPADIEGLVERLFVAKRRLVELDEEAADREDNAAITEAITALRQLARERDEWMEGYDELVSQNALLIKRLTQQQEKSKCADSDWAKSPTT